MVAARGGGDGGSGGDESLVTKSSPSPFLLKTYMLVDDPVTDDLVSWNSDGSGFVVWQAAEFARDLLPTLFKHSNFSSFVRQLNTYGFRKVATSRWEFCNEMFRKGRKEMLCQIRRRKSWANKAQPITQTLKECDEDQRSSSTNSLSLVDENHKLKKENEVLCSKLWDMKKKCKELIDLVGMYTSSSNKEDEDEDDQRPKLFGVRLELHDEKERKRKRIEEVGESARRILLSVSTNKLFSRYRLRTNWRQKVCHDPSQMLKTRFRMRCHSIRRISLGITSWKNKRRKMKKSTTPRPSTDHAPPGTPSCSSAPLKTKAQVDHAPCQSRHGPVSKSTRARVKYIVGYGRPTKIVEQFCLHTGRASSDTGRAPPSDQPIN